MPVDDTLFKEVRKAVEQGDRARAKDLLTRALQRDQNDATVWLWMSAVVDSPKERAYCLREVLRIDPDNTAAKRGLNMMGEIPPEPLPEQPQRFKRRNWQAEMEKAARPKVTTSWKKVALYGGAGILALGLVLFAIIGPNARKKPEPGPQSYRPYPTMTFTVTATPTVTPTPSEPTPPWQALAATYTPTPLYVNTPHPIIEAYSLSIRALQRGDLAKAIEYLNQSIQSEGNAPDLRYLLGEAYRLSGRYEEAIESYEQAISIQSGFAPAYLGRGLARWAMDAGQVEPVRDDLESALSLDPRLPETMTQLGLLEFNNGNFEGALERFNAAEAVNLAFPITYYYRARAHLAMNQADAAVADAERASQQDLTMLPAFLTLGDAMQAASRLIDSIVPYEIYLRYTPDPDPAVYYRIALAYKEAGDLLSALDSLNKMLAEVPDSATGLVERGNVHLEMGSIDPAAQDYEAALAIEGENFDAKIGIARVLGARQAYAEAVEAFNDLMNDDLNDAQRGKIFFYRAQALEAVDPMTAIIDWEQILALPEGAVPARWLEMARTRLNALYTPTPPQQDLPATPTPQQTP